MVITAAIWSVRNPIKCYSTQKAVAIATIVGWIYYKELLRESLLHFGVHISTSLACYAYLTLIRWWNVIQSRLKKSNKMQQYAEIYLLLNYSTCFGRPSLPSSGVHKTVVAASGTEGSELLQTWPIFEEARSPDSMICTTGCNYSFVYSWRGARRTPETCTVI